MENIKQKLSDFVHSTTAIVMITLFLFANNTVISESKAYALKAPVTTKLQIETTLNRISNTVYTPQMALSAKDLNTLLYGVGFRGQALRKAWAIAMRESHGRPMAYDGNLRTGDHSYGIFQINMLGQMGVDRKVKFNLRTNYELFDPVINAEITYKMTDGGTDWSAWKGINQPAQVYYQAYLTIKK